MPHGIVWLMLVVGFVWVHGNVAHRVKNRPKVDPSFPTDLWHRMLSSPSTLHHQTLRMQFTFKRSTMGIHGNDQLELLVHVKKPFSRDGAMEFEGIARLEDHTTPTDGSLVVQYSLVDRMAFVARVEPTTNQTLTEHCVSAEKLPPIHRVLLALWRATPLEQVDTLDLSTRQSLRRCHPGSQWIGTSFAGEEFVICPTSHAVAAQDFLIIGSDLDIDVSFSNASIVIPRPTNNSIDTSACRKLPLVAWPKAALYDPAKDLLSNWEGILPVAPSPLHRQHSRRLSLPAARCTCKSKPRPCVFFHGVAHRKEAALKNTTWYFGDIVNHAPCCSTVRFAEFNTVDFGWIDEDLQTLLCNFSLSLSNQSDWHTRTIEDAIIVGHSMGSLTFAGALANGNCRLGNSASYISISAPLRGSMGSDFNMKVCEGGGTIPQDLMQKLGQLVHQCPVPRANRILVYQGEKYSTAELNAAYDRACSAVKQHAQAVMCGRSSQGLNSVYKPAFMMANALFHHKSDQNDGLVEFQSCRGGFEANLFNATPLNTSFYVGQLNHMDTTFRNGDGLFGRDRKPVKWFECLL